MAAEQTAEVMAFQQKDHSEKVLASFPDVFADIGNTLVFKNQVIDPEQIMDGPTESIYKAADGISYLEQRRDVIKYVNGVGMQLAMIGMENQTATDNDLPIRVMGYDYATYRMQIKHGKLRYPVITSVLYFGDSEWNVARSLREIVDIPKEFEEHFVDYKINLIDVPRLTKDERANLTSDFKVIADYFAEKSNSDYHLDSMQKLDHPEAVVDFFRIFTGDNRFADSMNAIATAKKEGRDVRMCDLFDKAEERGLAVGYENTIRAIRKKLQKNLSVEDAADALELEPKDVSDVYDLIRQSPELSDLELAKIIIKKRNN